MGWPSIEDYRSALQNPKRSFHDPRLQGCTTEVNKMGLPWGRAGGFAIVYKLANSSWSTAVRVSLNAPKPDREARYKLVHAYLEQKKLRSLVDFMYDPEGILISGGRFPIQTLEWVDGLTLGEWFKKAISANDVRAIKQMADSWIKLVGELRKHRIAHCDLQHGNVMVRGDQPVLVDYDGMFVPTMETGKDKDREAWEFGLPGYQHPARGGQLLSAEIDNFSAWIILIALRAVADDPGLWHRFIGSKDEENMLIRAEDITDPARSELWPELINNAKDRMVREWAKNLRESLDGPFEKIPPFDIDIFGPLRTVIQGGDWRQIQELAASRKYANEDLPADLAPKVQEANKRVDCLAQLEDKIRGGRVKEIAAAYRPELLDDWVDAAVLTPARAAKKAAGLIAELTRIEQSDPTGRKLLALWDSREAELQGFPERDSLQVKVESWRNRIGAAERLDRAVKQGALEQAIVDASKALAGLGGHPDADAHSARADLAERRLKALVALRSLAAAEDEEADRALLKVWDPAGQALDGCPEADAFRARADAARKRARLLAELKRRIDEADQGRGDEHAVVKASDALPPGYGANLAARVRQARERIAASEALDRALRAVPQSDLAIAASAERARADGTWPTDPAVVARCELAIHRRDQLRILDAIPTQLPLDDQDAQWLAAWDESALGGDCHDARDQRKRHGQAVARTEAFAALEQALRAGDAGLVSRLVRDPRLADHPGLARRKAEIEKLIETSERAQRLLAAARAGQSEAFLNEAEPALLVANASDFAPYRARIESWVDSRLRKGDIIGQAAPPFLPGPNPSSVTARWTWTKSRLVRICLVAADPQKFLERPEDASEGTMKFDRETHSRALGGASLLLAPGCRKLFVTIWPEVDLGWTRRTGPPLKVGPYVLARTLTGPNGTGRAKKGPRPWTHRFQNWLEKVLNK